jgi:hypothetical protein
VLLQLLLLRLLVPSHQQALASVPMLLKQLLLQLVLALVLLQPLTAKQLLFHQQALALVLLLLVLLLRHQVLVLVLKRLQLM